MKIFKFILTLVFVIFIDILFTKIFSYRYNFFDPFLIIVVYYGTVSKPISAMMYGLTTGLVQDTWKEVIFGVNAFQKTLIAYLIALLASVFNLTNVFSRLLILLGATVIDESVGAGLMLLRGKGFDVLFFYALGVKLIGNGIIGSIIFYVVEKIAKRRFVTAL